MEKKARILVLDDELGPREALRMVLKSHYEVITASTGSEALDVVRREPPDLAFLDIQMREMNGLEVLKAIKSIDANIEVIMMTAYASLETAREAMSHGVSEYLIKPFSKSEIEQAVNKALDRRAANTGQQKRCARYWSKCELWRTPLPKEPVIWILSRMRRGLLNKAYRHCKRRRRFCMSLPGKINSCAKLSPDASATEGLLRSPGAKR